VARDQEGIHATDATGRGRTSPWQPRFWEHTIRDDADLPAHIDYVHINPMKHGLVERVADGPHSSFHRYVRTGTLPADWAGVREIGGAFGEVIPVEIGGAFGER